MKWYFPKYKDIPTDKTERWLQVLKVISETNETRQALSDETDQRVIEEALDVIHAAETLLRSYPEDMVDKEHAKVITKNQNRGYYS